MPNPGAVSEVITEPALKQVLTLTELLEKSQVALASNVDEVIKLNQNLAQTKGFKDFNSEANKAALAVEKLNKAQLQTELIQTRVAAAHVKASEAADKAAARQAAAAAKVEAAESKKTKTIVSNSQAEIDAYNRSAQGQENITSTINDTARAQALAANAATAAGGKQVAAAKSTVTATKQSVGLLETLIAKQEFYKEARKLTDDPAKILIYNKAIEETSVKIAQTTNAGKKGFDEFGNAVAKNTNYLGKAFSGLKTIANILPGLGIAGLLAFVATPVIEYIASLDLFRKKLTETQEGQQKLNQALASPEYSNAVKNVNELTINIDLAKKGFLDKDKVLNQYNTTIGKTTGQVTSLDEAEKALVKNGDAYIQMTLLKAAAQIALDEAAKKAYENAIQQREDAAKLARVQNTYIYDKEDAALNKIITKDIKRENDQRVKDGKTAVNSFKNIAKDFQNQAAEIAKTNKFNFFGDTEVDKPSKKQDTTAKDALEAQQRILEGQRNAAKAITEDQDENLQIRLDAAQVYQTKVLALIENEKKQSLLADDLTKSKRIAIEQDAQNKIASAKIEGENLTKKLNEDAYKELKKILDESAKANLEAEKNGIENQRIALTQRLVDLDSFKDESLAGLSDQYAKGLITEKQYNDQRLLITQQYNQDILQEQIKGIEQILAAEKAAGLDTASDEKKLADLKIALNKAANDQIIAQDEETAERRKALREQEKALADEVFNFTVALVDAGFDRQKNAIQDQIDLITVQKEKDIDAVNSSILSQQDKADKISVINAQAQAKQEALQARQRQLDVQKARFDKAASIAKIIENTAVSIIKTGAELGYPAAIPFQVLAGAIGAVQLATALATPIPKFEDGGTKRGDGLAMFGEVGTELRINPNGKLEFTPDVPTIGHVKHGTKFISNKELINMMSMPDMPVYSGGSQIDIQELIKSNDRGTRAIVGALNKRTQPKSGVKYYDTPKGLNYKKRNV